MVAVEGATPARTRRDAVFSRMVGALVLSRAIAGTDPALADEILAAGRDTLTAGRDDPLAPA